MLYLAGGRYISTDNAYVGAQKVLITPDIAGKISRYRGARRPACRRRRRAVRDRSRAVPPRAWRRRKARLAMVRDRLRQPEDQSQIARPARRAGAQQRRAQAARRRPQDDAVRQPHAARRPTSTPPPPALVAAQNQLTQLTQQEARHPQPAARQPRPADRAISALPAGQGGARPGAARPRPHGPARADRRHRDAGRQHPARPLRHGRHAGVQRHRRRRAVGRRQSEGDRHHLSARRAEGDDHGRHVPGPHLPRHRARRSAPAPARSSRSCRRRTRAATGSRSCSACRVRIAFDAGQDVTPAARRHERQRRHRQRPQALARHAVRLLERQPVKRRRAVSTAQVASAGCAAARW